MYEELFFRNRGALTIPEQRKLRSSRVAVIGLGGTGGFALENLLRTGVENLIVFDGDRFELTNMNRQLLCSIPALDQPKTKIARERANQINPAARVQTHAHFNPESVGILEEVDLVIDCTDRADTHTTINEACNILGKPQVFSACNYSQGMVSVLEGSDFRKMFQLPRAKKRLDRYHSCTSILAPAAAIAGSLAAAQAVAYLLGKSYIRAPELLQFDLFAPGIFSKKRLE